MNIHVTGEISIESFTSFSKKLHKAVSQDVSNINIVLSSHGGDALAALAFYDLMKRTDVSISVYATGIVASAAVLVLAAGKRRFMTPNAWVMVHEESIENLSGNVVAIEKEARQLRALENQWARLLAANSVATAEQWTELHKNETYLTAEQCLAYGLIQEITC